MGGHACQEVVLSYPWVDLACQVAVRASLEEDRDHGSEEVARGRVEVVL